MKFTKYKVAILFILVSSFCSSQIPCDYSFEKDNTLVNWNCTNVLHTIEIDSTIYRNGSHSLKMELLKSDTLIYPYGFAANYIPLLIQAKDVEISVFVKSKNTSQDSVNLFCTFEDEKGYTKYLFSHEKDSDRDSNWTRHLLKFTLPEGVNSFTYGFMLKGKGVVWFDDQLILIDGINFNLKQEELKFDIAEENIKSLLDKIIDMGVSGDLLTELNDESFCKSKLVGLGETTHRAKDVFKLKYDLIRHLISNCDFKILALEANMASVIGLNNFVLHGVGDPVNLIREIGFPMYRNQDFYDLVLWIRKYNKSAENKIQIFGYDFQELQNTIKHLKEYTQKLTNSNLIAYSKSLDTLVTLSNVNFGNPFFNDFNLINRIKDLNDSIRHELEKVPFSDTSSNNHNSLIWVKQLSVLIDQYVKDFENFHNQNHQGRDSFMAQNIEWILSTYPNEKVIISASNEHIRNSKFKMGHHLKRKYGDAYYPVGVLVNRGTYTAKNLDGITTANNVLLESKPGSLEHLLSRLTKSQFFIDSDVLKRTVRDLQPLLLYRSVGGVASNFQFVPLRTYDDFDAYIYIDSTSSAEFILNGN